jgi:hypothetical protein
MSPVPKQKAPEAPRKNAAKDLQKFAALPDKMKALSWLGDDTAKTSGQDAVKVRQKVKASDIDGGSA